MLEVPEIATVAYNSGQRYLVRSRHVVLMENPLKAREQQLPRKLVLIDSIQERQRFKQPPDKERQLQEGTVAHNNGSSVQQQQAR